jgi:hypothetical protein
VTDAAKKILAQIDELPDEELRWLVDVLVARVPGADEEDEEDEVREAWAERAIERLERAERGEAKLVSYDEVQADVEAVLRGE